MKAHHPTHLLRKELPYHFNQAESKLKFIIRWAIYCEDLLIFAPCEPDPALESSNKLKQQNLVNLSKFAKVFVDSDRSQ